LNINAISLLSPALSSAEEEREENSRVAVGKNLAQCAGNEKATYVIQHRT
jgi:hypothetical protein